MYVINVSKRAECFKGQWGEQEEKEDASGIYKCKYNGKRSGQSAWAVGYKCNL